MNPDLTKGLTMLVALALYIGSAYVDDMAVQSKVRELATMLIGWQAFRRAGDLGPSKE